MRYCTRCLYPDNHPLGITFDEQGVCSGCRVHEEKDELDWDSRRIMLERIFERYRNKSGNNFDCIIPVVGGKDSYFIVHVVKKIFGMNPLLLTFNHEFNTKIGIRNLANLFSVFDCDQITYTLRPDLLQKISRHTLNQLGTMYWHCLAGFQTFPVQLAVKMKIPLIVWGVHGWSDQVGMFSHLDEVEMTKRIRKEHSLMTMDAEDLVNDEAGISRRDVQPFVYPYDNELEKVGVRGVYLGNYIRWDAKKQHELMIKLYGYEAASQERTFNTYEDVECFHCAGLHDYIKFLKWGYGKVTDHACREIRLKRMTREEGINLVKQYEQKVPKDLPLYLEWAEMSEAQLYQALENKRDPKIWQKNSRGDWQLLDSVTNHVNDPRINEVRLKKIEECHYQITPSREPWVQEDAYVLMGRSFIDKYNYCAVDDTPKEKP